MIWGIVVLEPTTTITNLVLAAECWALFRLCQPEGIPRPIPPRPVRGPRALPAGGPSSPPIDELQTRSDQSRSWAGFFFFLGFATLLGAAKDGFPHYLGNTPLYLMVFGSSLASALGVLHAEAAGIRKHVRTPSSGRRLRLLSLGKFGLLVVAIALHDSIGFVIANTALGLIPIMVAEYLAFRRGDAASGWIAGGIALSSLAALAYISEVPAFPWFDHRDLPHVLMMGTLLMIFRGVANLGAPPHPPSAQRSGP